MKKNKLKLAQEWIQKAKEDEKVGLILIKEKGPLGAACFHDLTEILKSCLQLNKGFLK